MNLKFRRSSLLNCCDGLVCEPREKLTQSEKYLYKIWLEKDFPLEHLKTISGKNISIIDPGVRNETEGPDFHNAMIMLGDNLLSGDIEIHIKNKDWYFHSHDKDENYNNVILHVIKEPDQDAYIFDSQGKKIEILQLPLENSVNRANLQPCKKWASIDFDDFQEKIDNYANNRFQRKTLNIRNSLLQYQPEQYFFIGMLDVMGYSKNRVAMKSIAKVMDIYKLYDILDEIDDNQRLIFLEATLLGISGLLQKDYKKYYNHEVYFESLQKNWIDISKKYKFDFLEKQKFHFAGSRPANFPHKRLVALAQIINNIYPLKPGQFSMNILFSGRKFEIILQMLKEKFQLPSGMWKNHPLFKTHHSNLLIGDSRLMDFLTNVIIPFARALSSILKNEQNASLCIELNRKIPVGAIPGKIKDMLDNLGISTNKIKTNYLLQGCIEYFRLFCDLELCNICLLENRIKHD